jgi:hypothetical protein
MVAKKTKGKGRMSNALEVEQVDIADLLVDEKNVRKHSERNIEAIESSLRRFGQRRPLVVWKQQIIAGNGTVEAARRLGWTSISVTRVPDEWTREEATAYAIADNRTAELASWDDEALLANLNELRGFDLLEVTGFGSVDLDDLAVDIEELAETPSGIKQTLNLKEYVSRYADATVRILMAEYPNDVYVWVIDKLTAARETLKLDSNAETIAAVLGAFVGEKPPEFKE